jgi:hypothetical protein
MSQKLANSLANGYEVKIGDYISRGYEIFKANMGSFIVIPFCILPLRW